ncbi:Nif3-like dinuclear metal center hexameric protein [Patescibacteria group bacterium]|nr:Nif3-like dinuclear metal center hexameric protein [Patescibacteria group bacterium]
MKTEKLYEQLEKDFINPLLSDDWASHMESVFEFISDNFKKRSMGLVCDNSQEINKVYAAVFPSDEVMQSILNKNETDIMLFVHHPSIWDIRKAPEVWQQMDRNLLEQFRKRRISIYNLHVPLDNYGEYSTSVSLAKVLGIEIKKSFAPYFGALCGVFGKTEFLTIQELRKKFESVVGHKTGFYQNDIDEIKDKTVAIIAGGGNDVNMLNEIAKEGVNTFITGITILNDYSKAAHDYAKENKINILGGTHYSTEKFACIAICEYFKKLGLSAEFINDEPVLEDI